MSEAETKAEPAGPASGVSEELYLGDAIHFFLSAKRAGGRSQRTIDDYRKKLELFQRWVAARYGGEDSEEVDAPYLYIGADEVESYVVYLRDGRGMADSSRKNHLAVLRSFFQTLSRRLEVPDPTRTLDEVRFHSSALKRHYLTKREAEILLSSMDKQATNVSDTDEGSFGVSEARRRELAGAVLAARDHAAFSAMIYAGLRIEETTALKVEDLSFSRGEEEVRVARGKGNKERVVPMSPKLKRSLRRYIKARDELLAVSIGEAPPPHLFLNEKGERVTENTLRRRLYGWVRKSGLKKAEIKPHDLRRTFGTWYLQANPGHVRELAELMGHSDLSQVMKYALSDEQRARAGVAKL
jgi:integrase/recombinase XerD